MKPGKEKRLGISNPVDYHKLFTKQSLNIGKGRELVCIKGVWKLKGLDMPRPARLDDLVRQKRDREWRMNNEK